MKLYILRMASDSVAKISFFELSYSDLFSQKSGFDHTEVKIYNFISYNYKSYQNPIIGSGNVNNN